MPPPISYTRCLMTPALAFAVAVSCSAPAERARALYFSKGPEAAAEAFEAAVKSSSGDASAWLDGSIAWAEAGRPEKAVEWSRRAAELGGAEESAALGWALLRAGRPGEAEGPFRRALELDHGSSWAALGAGRAELAAGRLEAARELLRRAEQDPPQQALAALALGQVEEARGDEEAAAEAYRRAVATDAYFHEGRGPLSRVYLKLKRPREAWRQLLRLADAEPGSKLTRAMMAKARPLLEASAPPEPRAPAERAPIMRPADASEMREGVPLIRVGLSTTRMGKPRPRVSVTVRGAGPWRAVDPKTGRTLASCPAQEPWTVRLVPGSRKARARLELRGPEGQAYPVPGDDLRLEPAEPERDVLSVEDDPKGGPPGVGRPLRGVIEVSAYNRRRSLRLVNVVNLEDYTHGVVGAEMPSASPLEALKAQAVMARTHALYLKGRRRHKEGYDLCDEQHCQVYVGARQENARTRAAVAETRGKVAVHGGRPAHVIYASNCGGSTQSGIDVGWGDVPYWGRVVDAPEPILPDSPGALRRFLASWPDAYCRPSHYVHPSHSRWARVTGARELQERVNRKRGLGTLKAVRVTRRAPSGHVRALLLVGSRRSAVLTREIDIRGLLGYGSLRSTLFTVETEYRREGKSLVPAAFVFRGGGWGHSVGLCQSGAIGRAEAGADHEAIVKAYFAGVGLETLGY